MIQFTVDVCWLVVVVLGMGTYAAVAVSTLATIKR